MAHIGNVVSMINLVMYKFFFHMKMILNLCMSFDINITVNLITIVKIKKSLSRI